MALHIRALSTSRSGVINWAAGYGVLVSRSRRHIFVAHTMKLRDCSWNIRP